MFTKKIILILLVFLSYQTQVLSKSTTLNELDAKNLSNYFSGIVAYENKENNIALKFFNSSKKLLNKHDPYLKRYVNSLVLEGKVSQAINIVKKNIKNENSNFFDAHLLLILDSLKKNDFNKAYDYLNRIKNLSEIDRFNGAILESLHQYLYVFKEKKILKNKKSFGKLSFISETFQRCYLGCLLYTSPSPRDDR